MVKHKGAAEVGARREAWRTSTMAGRSPKCPSCSRGAAGAQEQKVTCWPHWSQLRVACSQALDRQAAVCSLGSSLASTVTSTARLLGAAAGSHAQNTAVCERERC